MIISYLLPLSVTTTSLPAATGGHSYTATLAATGGVAPYSWSVPPGTLPPGLSLSSAGVISGIPDVAGTYTFTVKVTDWESTPMTATKVLSISVSGPMISALRPDHGPSFGGTVVEISGTGLACPRHDRSCRVSVTFGGHRALVLFASSTAVLVIAPPGHGTVQVTVTVGGVSSQATAAGLFTYQFELFRFLLSGGRTARPAEDHEHGPPSSAAFRMHVKCRHGEHSGTGCPGAGAGHPRGGGPVAGAVQQAYLLALLEEDARRARNVMLLRQVRQTGGGYAAAPGETVDELGAIRAERDQRNADGA